jgi:GNAT superfamily N-acetyltransferase
MSEELARAWVTGWAVSRGTPPPVPEPWGLRVDVGLPEQRVRQVLLRTDRDSLRTLSEQVTAAGTWLRAFVPTESFAPWLSADWSPSEPHQLMATDLPPGPSQPPRPASGYRLAVETGGGVVRARVLAADGSLAARGQVAPVRRYATFDQVVTEPGHQRRGLGSLVMRTLANAAVDAGARHGVLGATDQGRALYESLGWTVRAPLVGFVR